MGRKVAVFKSSAEAFELGSRTLMVLDLAWSVNAHILRAKFSEVGPVEAAEVKVRPDGLSRGFGWVRMATREGALKAVEQLHNAELSGRTIRLDWSKPVLPWNGRVGAPRTPRVHRDDHNSRPNYTPGDLHVPNKLFVGNLPRECTDAALVQAFEERAGEVLMGSVIRWKDTDVSRGFGFVVMADAAGADKAVSLAAEGWDLGGRQLQVNPPRF